MTINISEAPPERREILAGYEEGIYFGMPGYKYNGTIVVGFASQKNYISLYILKEDVMQANRQLLGGLSVGKGCIRNSNLKKMDVGVIRKLLLDTVNSTSTVC